MTQLNVVFWSGCGGETQRYRCEHAIALLQQRGHTASLFWQTDPAVIAAIAEADLVIIHRPQQSHFWQFVRQAAAGRPLVYETDDLLFDPSLVDAMPIVAQNQGFERQRWRAYALGNAPVFEQCVAATVSTSALAEAATALGKPVWVQRNVIGDDWLAWCERAYRARTTHNQLTIGYFSGTFSHNADLALIAPALVTVLQQYPQARLLLGGHIDLPDALKLVADQVQFAPFVPLAELPNIMAQADIVIAPLDYENQFTRCRSELKYLEAAALRLPMVATPIPAFAQAIEHGQNGFLAQTLEQWQTHLIQLLQDSALREQIGQAAYAHVCAKYTVATAAAGYETSLHEILSQFQQPHAQLDYAQLTKQFEAELGLIDQQVHMVTGCDVGNAGNYRCRHRQEQLHWYTIQSEVTSLYVDPMEIAKALRYDLLILHRVAHDPMIEELIYSHQALQHPVIFDTDDLVFRPDLLSYVDAIKDWPAEDVALYRDGVERYRRTMLMCDAVIVSTEPLAEQVRIFGLPAYVVRNALSQQQLDHAQPFAAQRRAQPLPAATDPVTIGYFSGTATHNSDFLQAEAAILQILQQYPHVRLRIVGLLELSSAFDSVLDRVERRGLVPLPELAGEIAAVDFALAPLELDNPFCQSKSEVKYMEAGLVGVPLVASPIEAFQVAITHGVNGMLAANHQEWVAALTALVTNPELRRELGEAALVDVHARYTPQARSQELFKVLQTIRAQYQPRPARGSANNVIVDQLNAANSDIQRLKDEIQALTTLYNQTKDYAQGLEQHIQRVANGRVMRLSNRLNQLFQRVLARKG
ncbi:MAG: glycosyltransferase family 4 protein [Chloroflexi bacterium]|nr:glycosyltransferase family 4 protein [Chloroflexota bacterium]